MSLDLAHPEGRSQSQRHTKLQKAVWQSQHQQMLCQPQLNTATLVAHAAEEQLKHIWHGKHPRQGSAQAAAASAAAAAAPAVAVHPGSSGGGMRGVVGKMSLADSGGCTQHQS